MNTKQLVTFKIAAETLNFTKTANILNFAQSSVTAHIKALEEELGKPLFERLGKRLALTEAGREFTHYAEQMIQLDEKAKVAIGGQHAPFETLTIGAQESQCTYRLPAILKEFKALYPHVKLLFKPAHSDENARADLMSGKLDAAFIMDATKPEHALTIKPLIEEEIVFIAAANHHLAAKSQVALKDLETETLLLTEDGCSYRKLLEHSCHLENVYPMDNCEFSSIEAIKQCAISGLGIAALPMMVVEQDIASGKLAALKWANSFPPIFTHIAWHKDKAMAPALNDFIELTQKTFRSKS